MPANTEQTYFNLGFSIGALSAKASTECKASWELQLEPVEIEEFKFELESFAEHQS